MRVLAAISEAGFKSEPLGTMQTAEGSLSGVDPAVELQQSIRLEGLGTAQRLEILLNMLVVPHVQP